MKKIIVIGVIALFIIVGFQPAFANNIMENHPPYEPSNPYPNGNNISICPPNLSWTGGDPDDDNVTYDVYFGDNPKNMNQIVWNQTKTWFVIHYLDFNKTYYWYVVAWDEYGDYTIGPLWSFTTEANLPPNPAVDPIPFNGDEGVPTGGVILKWNGSDPNECDTLYYDVYFDDVNPPITKRTSKIINDYWVVPFVLSKYKTYYWRVDTWDKTGEFCQGNVWRFTTNCFPPSKPIIDGPCSGKKNQMYNFTFLSTDPYNDIIYYYVKWGDGIEEITDFYENGTPATLSHSWNTIGDKYITAKAINEYGAESGWSIFEFTVPRNKVFNLNLFELLFTKFPLLQRLLEIWRNSVE